MQSGSEKVVQQNGGRRAYVQRIDVLLHQRVANARRSARAPGLERVLARSVRANRHDGIALLHDVRPQAVRFVPEDENRGDVQHKLAGTQDIRRGCTRTAAL